MNLLSVAAGAISVGVLYFLYLVATKGLPAAWAWLKTKWNASKAGLATLETAVGETTIRVASLETNVGSLGDSLTLLKSDFARIEALIPRPATPAAANPASPPAPNPQPAA